VHGDVLGSPLDSELEEHTDNTQFDPNIFKSREIYSIAEERGTRGYDSRRSTTGGHASNFQRVGNSRVGLDSRETSPERSPPSFKMTTTRSRKHVVESPDDEASQQNSKGNNGRKGRKVDPARTAMLKDLKQVNHQDRNLSPTKLLPTLRKLRENYYILQKKCEVLEQERGGTDDDGEEIYDMKEQLKTLQLQLDAAQAERDHLQQKLKTATKNMRDRSKIKQGTVLVVNQALKTIVDSKAKSIVWGMVKFIQSEDEEENAAKLLLKYASDDLPAEILENRQSKLNFVATYKTYVKKAIFNRRNYVSSEFKKLYIKKMEDGEPVLSVQDLLKCLQRDIKTEEDMQKFMYYWDELLQKQTKADWGKSVKYYETISESVRKDCDRPTITSQDEAFTVLLIENALQRWTDDAAKNKVKKEKAAAIAKNNEAAIANGKENEPVADENVPVGNENEIAGKDSDGDGQEIPKTQDQKKTQDKKKKVADGLFSSSVCGQNEWGGWSEEGLEKYMQYLQLNQAARLNPNTAQVEKDCLKLLRQKNRIVCTDVAEQKRLNDALKRNKKRGREVASLPVRKKLVRTIIDIAESSDEEEEDEVNQTEAV
jgi:hypothetical protein